MTVTAAGAGDIDGKSIVYRRHAGPGRAFAIQDALSLGGLAVAHEYCQPGVYIAMSAGVPGRRCYAESGCGRFEER